MGRTGGVSAGRLAMLSAATMGLALGGPVLVAAQEGGMPPVPEACEVVAEGLASPRGIALGLDGTIYVSEAGIGGDETVTPPGAAPEEAPQVATPSAVDERATPPAAEPDEGEGGPPLTRGDSGQITQIAPDGTQSVLASGLASYSEGVGPSGLVFADDQLWVAVGGAGVALGAEPLPTENTIVRIDPATGETAVVAELGSYEVENNPDATDINPNIYGMDFAEDGRLYVADAGGNSLYAVDPATGEITFLGVVPTLSGLTGATPEADPSAERQSVPTGVAVGADGTVYVALLSEAWPPDAPNIVRLTEPNSFEPVASGLTAVVDLTAGPDGALYATQLWSGFEGDMPLPGTVERIQPDGTTETVLEGVFLPHGVAVAEDGALYVTANSLAFGPEPMGQLLRCDIGEGADAGAAASPSAAVLPTRG